jgi:hypothetical protein
MTGSRVNRRKRKRERRRRNKALRRPKQPPATAPFFGTPAGHLTVAILGMIAMALLMLAVYALGRR